MADVEPERRRSRFAWPTQTEPATTPAGTHSHRQNNRPLAFAYVAIVLLLLAAVALSYFVWLDHQYVQGRGEYRDRENARLEEQLRESFREGICRILDGLPEGGLLEDDRQFYGCGPGIPLEDLPADIRQQYEGNAPAAAPTTTPPAPTSTTQPPMGAPAVPNPPRPTPSEPPFTTPPKPSPTPPAPTPAPEDVLDPVTDTVCDLLGVCI